MTDDSDVLFLTVLCIDISDKECEWFTCKPVDCYFFPLFVCMWVKHTIIFTRF